MASTIPFRSSSPSPASSANTSPSPKKPALRQRMTSAIRRSSAFSLGSKPSTPRANTDSNVNPLTGTVRSKSASNASVVEPVAIEAPTTAEREPSVGATTAESAAPTEESKAEAPVEAPVEIPVEAPAELAKEIEQPKEEIVAAPTPTEEPTVVAQQPIEPAGILDPAWTAIPALEDPIPEMRLRPVRNPEPEPVIQPVEQVPEPIPAPQEITPASSEGIVEEPLPQSESPTSLSRATSKDNLKHENKPLSPILESPVTATNESATTAIPKEKDGEAAPVQDAAPPPVFIPVNPAAVNPPILVVPMPHPRTVAPSDESSDGPTPRPGEGVFNFPEPATLKNKPSMTYVKAMPVDPEQQQQHPEGFVVAVPITAPPMPVPEAAPPMPVPEPAEVPKTAPIPIPQAKGLEQNPAGTANEYPFYADYIDDPFRDPATPIARQESHGTVELPTPNYNEPIVQDYPPPSQPPFAQATEAPVVVPLPPMSELTSVQAVRHMPSDYTLAGRSSGAPSIHEHRQPDERQPLLTRSAATGKQTESINAASTEDHHTSAVSDTIHLRTLSSHSYAPPNSSLWPTHQPSLHSHGWTEHDLPDTTVYYTHDDLRITTDVDLRSPRKLQALNLYLSQKRSEQVDMGAPPNWECWLRDAAPNKNEFVPARCWINHEERTVSFSPPPGSTEHSLPANEDKLELEHRYWSFMESHPAHAVIPFNAPSEAMDVLTWSYTDALLTRKSHTRPPFDHEECQQLMGILRSLDTINSEIQRIILTRTVSRILLRAIQWRQRQLKHKSSRDRAREPRHNLTGRAPSPPPRPQHTALDYVLTILSLGIPFLFANRHGRSHYDVEEGGWRLARSLLVIGGSLCLVAAIVLSASVTFLALPGLDNAARTASLICIICTVASLASSIVAAFRHQAEFEAEGSDEYSYHREMDHGFPAVTPRGRIFISLPAVFLAYGMIAFVTAVMLYVFRGFTDAGGGGWSEKIQEYTRWSVLGVLGFCASVVVIGMILVKRS